MSQARQRGLNGGGTKQVQTLGHLGEESFAHWNLLGGETLHKGIPCWGGSSRSDT